MRRGLVAFLLVSVARLALSRAAAIEYPGPNDQIVLGGVGSSNKHHGARPNREGAAGDSASSSSLLPSPLRQATGFVAFGDSYSAGIGTGVEGKEEDCRQGVHAHPSLIFDDLTADRPPNATSFQWLSCTGATAEDVLSGSKYSQIDAFNASYDPETGAGPDFGMLSIGGNDMGFFDVINACVFRFYSYYSGTCEQALTAAELLVADGSEFDHHFTIIVAEILDKVRWEKRPDFFLTVTGYARFFVEETDECDNSTFGVWWGGPKLHRGVRRRMNALVGSVNTKLTRLVAEANRRYGGGGDDFGRGGGERDRLYFVDYDAAFEGHRFCEAGVLEPDYNRTDTWFFLVGGPDNAPGMPPPNETYPGPPPPLPDPSPRPPPPQQQQQLKGQYVDSLRLPPDSPLVDPNTCLALARRSGDWGELALCYMAMAAARDPTLRLATQPDGVTIQNSMWYVPTYYGKSFHPRSLGHEVIKDKVYELWERLERGS